MKRTILYILFLVLTGSCASKVRAPRQPILPWKRKAIEAKVDTKAPGEAAPEPVAAPSPQCTCDKCKCDPCVCKTEVSEAPKPVAAGRWVLVQRPVYGGFRGRQFQGYQKFWQWQGPVQATQTYNSCSNGQCGR